jgi:beta-alanine degradation protein BauB
MVAIACEACGPRSSASAEGPIGHGKAKSSLRFNCGSTSDDPLAALPFAMANFGEHKVMEQTDGYTEITGKNFEGWPPELIEESKRANANGRVGTKLLLESHLARIWVIELKPGERLPFHRHVLKYFWTVLTEGAGRSHTPDGLTRQIKYRAGDTKHLEYRKDEGMSHDLQNVGTGDLVFITVEFVQSENKPLSLEQGAP